MQVIKQLTTFLLLLLLALSSGIYTGLPAESPSLPTETDILPNTAIPSEEANIQEETEEENTMYIQIGETVWTAALEDNPSADAWRELLAQGPVTVDMSDYGGFEKVGGIGTSLPQSNRQITTRPGDIILYQGTSITIYYDTNTWNFTPLGHVENVTQEDLKKVLKAGGENVSVTFSLTEPTL